MLKGERHLREALASFLCEGVQGSDLLKLLLGEISLLEENSARADSAILGNAAKIAVGQKPLRRRAENDNALLLISCRVQESV